MGTNIPKVDRKPVFEAAQSGDPRRIDAALEKLDPMYLEGIRELANGDWNRQLGTRVGILLQGVDTRSRALAASTPVAPSATVAPVEGQEELGTSASLAAAPGPQAGAAPRRGIIGRVADRLTGRGGSQEPVPATTPRSSVTGPNVTPKAQQPAAPAAVPDAKGPSAPPKKSANTTPRSRSPEGR